MKAFSTQICLVALTLLIASTGCGPQGAHEPDQTSEALSWAKGAVWYQIFPERFRNGDAANDPVKSSVVKDNIKSWQVQPWTSDWYALQPWEKERGQSFYEVVFDRRYGGDLVGVIEKLDYLSELGIDVIYFNPIFEAHSLHKYDASTYHHIDNNFGRDRARDLQAIKSETENPDTWSWTSADKVFLELIEKAHAKGIRIVIDGVFNHCGTEFWAFQDVVQNQQASRYSEWFDVLSWDDPATPDTNEFDHKGWWGYKPLPEFKEDEQGLIPPVRDYIFNITRRWMDPNGDGDPSDGIDGWRLDVAKDVSVVFWEDWYRLVKSINPAAITVGEIWEEAGEWIEKKRFDAVMNYPFAYPAIDFFVDRETQIASSQFDKELARVRQLYSAETNLIMMNLVDGHDTDRIASMIMNPDRKFDRDAGPWHNQQYDPTKPDARARKIQKLIALFQMTYIGAPMIYYGDEAGMWGADDPDDRKPMLWGDLKYEDETYSSVLPDNTVRDKVEFDAVMFDYYKNLIRLRHENPPLQLGTMRGILTDDERRIYGFSRAHDGETLVVLLNNNEESQDVRVPVGFPAAQVLDLLSGKQYPVSDGEVHLSVGAFAGAVLKKL